MADEAHKEPTMEEILSSIRKIISEEDAPAEEVSPPTPEPEFTAAETPVNDEFDDIALDPVDQEEEISFAGELEEEDIFEVEETYEDEEDEFGDELALAEEDDTFGEVEELEDDAEQEGTIPAEVGAKLEDIQQPVAVAPAIEPEPEPATPSEPVQPEVRAEEPAMSATAKYESTVLTDERTADAAAGALGQLISRMDLGGENTIEALVRELLKPMIKDWLDTNLPSIVEEKVEAEVQRIARMAR